MIFFLQEMLLQKSIRQAVREFVNGNQYVSIASLSFLERSDHVQPQHANGHVTGMVCSCCADKCCCFDKNCQASHLWTNSAASLFAVGQ
jgi:hypothetical protein